MTTSTFQQTATSPVQDLAPSLRTGALAGLGGGLLFGMMMGMMGMLPMVAKMVGASSAALGFVLHMGISAFIGATYGSVARFLPSHTFLHLIAGSLNGLTWWILGALILMPLALGMPQMVLVVGQPQVMSLVGHLFFGIVTALVFSRLNRKA
ncbi:MAG: hypothetical protein ACE5G0_13435 [Rhodothermales bacterium]